MYFDRFDICEAYYLFFSRYHDGQWSEKYKRLCKLTRPGFFKPSLTLKFKSLSDNGKAIYNNLVRKLNAENKRRRAAY